MGSFQLQTKHLELDYLSKINESDMAKTKNEIESLLQKKWGAIPVA